MMSTAYSETSTTASQSPLKNVLLFSFIGPPNGGKGTQTSFLAEKYNLPRVDMGATLREMAKAETVLGRTIQGKLSNGQLVETPIVMEALAASLEIQLQKRQGASASQEPPKGFILDGFPRSLEQVQGLLQLCDKTGAVLSNAFYITVPHDVILNRATNRRICPVCGTIYSLISKPPLKEDVCDKEGAVLSQRPDDMPDKVEMRLQSFAEDTSPILERFEKLNLLVTIDGNRSVELVSRDLSERIELLLNS
jgi:adenylate kinase